MEEVVNFDDTELGGLAFVEVDDLDDEVVDDWADEEVTDFGAAPVRGMDCVDLGFLDMPSVIVTIP